MSLEPGQSAPSKAEIEACSDAATLALWYREMVELIEDMKAQVFGLRTAHVAGEDWLQRVGRKVGYLKMAARWIELRMITLGLPVPYLPSDPRQEELRRQRAVIDRLHKALVAAGVAIPELPPVRGGDDDG